MQVSPLTVGQIVGRAIELEEGVQLALQHGQCLQQLLGVHRADGALLLAPLHLAEVEGDRAVGHGLLVQVLGVPANERRHVVTWRQTTNDPTQERIDIRGASEQIIEGGGGAFNLSR